MLSHCSLLFDSDSLNPHQVGFGQLVDWKAKDQEFHLNRGVMHLYISSPGVLQFPGYNNPVATLHAWRHASVHLFPGQSSPDRESWFKSSEPFQLVRDCAIGFKENAMWHRCQINPLELWYKWRILMNTDESWWILMFGCLLFKPQCYFARASVVCGVGRCFQNAENSHWGFAKHRDAQENQPASIKIVHHSSPLFTIVRHPKQAF